MIRVKVEVGTRDIMLPPLGLGAWGLRGMGHLVALSGRIGGRPKQHKRSAQHFCQLRGDLRGRLPPLSRAVAPAWATFATQLVTDRRTNKQADMQTNI